MKRTDFDTARLQEGVLMEDMPLYRTIYDDLRKKIEDGTYSENVALPSERVLCQMYHVSRSTIRSALNELCRNDYIVKSHGNGNFVKPKMFEQKITKFYSFADSLKAQHILIKNLVIDYEIVATDKYLDSLPLLKPDFATNVRWHKLTRLRSAEDSPLMIVTSYLPQWRFHKIETDVLRDTSLCAYLRKYHHMVVTDANEFLSPSLPNNRERTLLQISAHTPCMLCELFSYERENLISIDYTVVRGDKFKFKFAYR